MLRLPFQPTDQRQWRTKVNRKRERGLWTCLVVVSSSPLGQFHSSLSGYQQFSSIANTKLQSVAVVQSSRNFKAPPNQHKPGEVTRISWKPQVLWPVSLYEVKISEDQQRPVKTHKVFHGVAMAMQERPFPVCGVLFIFFLNITCPFKCLFSVKHLMPSLTSFVGNLLLLVHVGNRFNVGITIIGFDAQSMSSSSDSMVTCSLNIMLSYYVPPFSHY